MLNNIPTNEKLSGKTTEEVAELFASRMEYMYLKIPNFNFEYPNSYDGDCLKIAHELARRVLSDGYIGIN